MEKISIFELTFFFSYLAFFQTLLKMKFGKRLFVIFWEKYFNSKIRFFFPKKLAVLSKLEFFEKIQPTYLQTLFFISHDTEVIQVNEKTIFFSSQQRCHF